MGMYTEFRFKAKLKRNTPDSVLTILKVMLNPFGDFKNINLPEHDLFKTERFDRLFTCIGNFEHKEHSTLEQTDGVFQLKVISGLKNYDQEIQKFCSWIAPWIDEETGTEVGTHQYEECEKETLLIFQGDRVDELIPFRTSHEYTWF